MPTSAIYVPDEVLLRRFGLVRAVGTVAWVAVVVVLFGVYGLQVWPLALGVPVLAVVTRAYYRRSAAHPLGAVTASLVADALVLGGAVAFVGGTGSGLVSLYAIVVVSAGILLGPGAAAGFTAFAWVLGLAQLGIEQLGFTPALLHRPDLSERIVVLLAALAGVTSVGYLSGIYAGRLQELLLLAGQEAEAVRLRGRRRRAFVRQADRQVRALLRRVDELADALDRPGADAPDDRRRLAGQLRMVNAMLAAEVGRLRDASTLDEIGEVRPEPVLLRRAVADSIAVLGERLAGHHVEVDVPPIKVVADRRGVRRVVFSLLENVAEHTPPGTHVHITALESAGNGVLVVTDDGSGIPPETAATLFDPEPRAPRVGLPLTAELCAAMGGQVRYEPAPSGGARFLVAFKLAPASAPSPDDEP
ncbi:MAG TPA: HAMP domain-containing sensor histidine kinase [Egibacteraceae bacterium]